MSDYVMSKTPIELLQITASQLSDKQQETIFSFRLAQLLAYIRFLAAKNTTLDFTECEKKVVIATKITQMAHALCEDLQLSFTLPFQSKEVAVRSPHLDDMLVANVRGFVLYYSDLAALLRFFLPRARLTKKIREVQWRKWNSKLKCMLDCSQELVIDPRYSMRYVIRCADPGLAQKYNSLPQVLFHDKESGEHKLMFVIGNLGPVYYQGIEYNVASLNRVLASIYGQ